MHRLLPRDRAQQLLHAVQRLDSGEGEGESRVLDQHRVRDRRYDHAVPVRSDQLRTATRLGVHLLAVRDRRVRLVRTVLLPRLLGAIAKSARVQLRTQAARAEQDDRELERGLQHQVRARAAKVLREEDLHLRTGLGVLHREVHLELRLLPVGAEDGLVPERMLQRAARTERPHVCIAVPR